MKRRKLLRKIEKETREESSSTGLAESMELVKSAHESIATSQKLIAQMMEEMAEVVESLTSATKSALDANGRILRTVSRIG